MKEVFRKNISSDFLDYVELISYLRETDLLILDRIIKQKSEYKFDKEIFDYYREQLTKHNFEQKQLNKELVKNFAGEKYLNDNYFMEVDFKERELVIYEN